MKIYNVDQRYEANKIKGKFLVHAHLLKSVYKSKKHVICMESTLYSTPVLMLGLFGEREILHMCSCQLYILYSYYFFILIRSSGSSSCVLSHEHPHSSEMYIPLSSECFTCWFFIVSSF